MADYPTRYYEIKRLSLGRSGRVTKVPNPNVNFFTDRIEAKLLSSLPDAEVFFAPGDIGQRLFLSPPKVVSMDMCRLPFRNIFIEFGRPIVQRSSWEQGSFDPSIQLFGVHFNEVDFLEMGGPVPKQYVDKIRTMCNRFIALDEWWRDARRGTWAHKSGGLIIGGTDGLRAIGESGFVGGALEEFPHEAEAVACQRELATVILFMNSSNVSYEIQKEKPPPRSERAGWDNSYASPFRMLAVKDIPDRIRLALRRNEAGLGFKWGRGGKVRAHFKQLSYCKACGRKKAIRRFLFKETCNCGVVLDPEINLVTKLFWWDEHWAGPDIAYNVLEGATT